MIPLVGTSRSWRPRKPWRAGPTKTCKRRRCPLELPEDRHDDRDTPRRPDGRQVAEEGEFFSFGTNDLTQMTFGFSRDDINTFLPIYLRAGILPNDPFQQLDQTGVGQLVEMACREGPRHQARPAPGHLRRAWWRPGVHRLLPRGGPRLRELLAVPGAHRPAGGRPGGHPGGTRPLKVVSKTILSAAAVVGLGHDRRRRRVDCHPECEERRGPAVVVAVLGLVAPAACCGGLGGLGAAGVRPHGPRAFTGAVHAAPAGGACARPRCWSCCWRWRVRCWCSTAR